MIYDVKKSLTQLYVILKNPLEGLKIIANCQKKNEKERHSSVVDIIEINSETESSRN